MHSQSPVCTTLAQRALPRLPGEYRRDGQSAKWFIQEILWALWLEVVDSLLDGPPPPDLIGVGRGQVPLEISDWDWADFRSELGLDSTEIEQAVSRLLGQQLFRPEDRGSVRSVPLPDPLKCLVLLACDLDQREHSKKRFSFNLERDIHQIIFRHPTPAAFGPPDSFPSFDAVIAYAGLHSSQRSGPLRSCYHDFYLPLRKRLEGRTWTPRSTDFVDGTIAKLRDVLRPRPPVSIEPIGTSECEEPVGTAAADSQFGLSALASLLVPVLAQEDDPLEHAKRSSCRLGEQLSLAVAKLLEGDHVEWYGRPGTRVVLSLPQSDWKLDDRAAVPLNAAEPHSYLIVNWGLKLYGRLICPSRIVPDLRDLS